MLLKTIKTLVNTALLAGLALVFLSINPAKSQISDSGDSFLGLQIEDKSDENSLIENFVREVPATPTEDIILEPTVSPEAQSTALTVIPDGEGLLFLPRVERLQLEGEIYGIKREGEIFLSFFDFVQSLELAIKVSDSRAAGWFLREDWRFELDLNTRTLQSRGVDFSLTNDDVFVDQGDIFIKTSKITEWMGFGVDFNFSAQILELETPFPLPIVARNQRRNRRIRGNDSNNPELPRIEGDPEWLDVNTADITSRTLFRQSGSSGDRNLDTELNVALSGEALKHQAFTLFNFDSGEGLESTTIRLFKQSEDPNLLGVLKAREYEIGDVDTARIPLTGGADRELGFSITNDTLNNNDLQTTVIRGDTIPGWDVELYRNGALIDLQTVGAEGQYEFLNVELFLGDNEFELLFYGLQGEVRSEFFNIPVTRELLQSQQGIYEISASLTGEQSFSAIDTDDVDEGTPHLAGTYSFAVGDALGFVGGRARNVDDEFTVIGVGGVSGISGQYFYDTNFAIDEGLELAAQGTLRRNFRNDVRVSLQANASTDAFGATDGDNVATLGLQGLINAPYDPFIGNNGRINSSYTFTNFSSGGTNQLFNVTASQQLAGFNISNAFNYIDQDPAGAGTNDPIIDQTLSVRGVRGRWLWRTALNYDYAPEASLDDITATVTYRPSNKFTFDTDLRVDPDQDFSEIEFRANYLHDKFRITPFIEFDSESDIFAGLTINTSLIDDPGAKYPIFSGRNTTATGYVSAFVFLDQDGNWQYDPKIDTVLPDVIVESVNIRRRVETNENGFSLIRDLPVRNPTDIRIDQETFPDPFLIASYPGRSVFPRAGEITDIIFPVFNGSEIDGTVRIKTQGDRFKSFRAGTVRLIPFDPSIEAMNSTVIDDGFFIFSRIRPGRYFMFVDHEDVDFNLAAAPPPRILDIGYEGGTLFGTDIELQEGLLSIPFQVTYRKDIPNPPEGLIRPTPLPPAPRFGGGEPETKRPAPRPQYYVRLNRKGSNRLLRVLEDLEIKKLEQGLLKNLLRFETYDEQKEERVFRYRPKIGSYAEAADLCENLIATNVRCAVEAIPPAPDPQPVPSVVSGFVQEFLSLRDVLDLDKIQQRQDFLNSENDEEITIEAPAVAPGEIPAREFRPL